jgi:DNA topoisomerase I
MPRLRNVSPNSVGWTRRRAGKGFTYLDEHGDRLDPEHVDRIKSLAIPPAWEDVWICPHENGHIQAVGIDDAGRRQYLYHPDWRTKRDEQKFDHVTKIARKLPKARAAILEDIALDGMPLERAAATAVRLLDLGYFRIGSDAYVDAHGSFGLTTLEKRHVQRSNGHLVFSFNGKSGIEHTVEIDDSLAVAAVDTMRRRRGGGDKLLAYKNSRRWKPIDAGIVNDYLRDATGTEITAKDFRTWHATVLAAESLATTDEPGESKASRKRAVRNATNEVAEYLGNTPAIAKSSYIDPKVIDLYEDGATIEKAVGRSYKDDDKRRDAVERAVLRLLCQAPDARSCAARSR